MKKTPTDAQVREICHLPPGREIDEADRIAAAADLASTDTTTEDTRPDYEVAREELRRLYTSLGITADLHSRGLRKDESGWEHRAWTVTLMRNGVGKEFPWRQGTGIKTDPDPAEVLGLVCADVRDAEQSFEGWATEFGYDTDSRKAESVWRKCRSIGVSLNRLGIVSPVFDQLADLANRL